MAVPAPALTAPPPWLHSPLHHVALKVVDLGRIEAFYHGTLGLPLLRRQLDAGGALRSVWCALGGGAILMLEARGGRERGDLGWQLVALQVAAAARPAIEAALAARGVPVVGRTAYTLYVEDPEGNAVGFSHYPEAAADADADA